VTHAMTHHVQVAGFEYTQWQWPSGIEDNSQGKNWKFGTLHALTDRPQSFR
jgi:hypothetical protein